MEQALILEKEGERERKIKEIKKETLLGQEQRQEEKKRAQKERKEARETGKTISKTSLLKKVITKKHREYLEIILLLGVGILGRILLQHIPSIEPIIGIGAALAIIHGKKAIIPSMIAFYVSNYFVWGGQGPWTIIQVIATGIAIITAAKIGKKSKTLALLGAGIMYEIVMNIYWPQGIILAIPYSIAHVISTIGFGYITLGAYKTRK